MFSLVLPSIAAVVIIVLRLSEAEHKNDTSRNLNIARAFSAGIDRELFDAKAALQALAVSDDLQRGELAGFYEQCVKVAAQHQARILLVDSEANPILNTLRPLGTIMPRIREVAIAKTAIATGETLVSDLFRATTTSDTLVAVFVPTIDVGNGSWVLIMSFAPERLSQSFAGERTPDEWTIELIDRQMRLLGRNRALDAFLGKPVTAEMAAAVRGPAEGSSVLHTPDGDEIYTAFVRSEFSGWTLALGIPRGVVDAPLRRSLIWIGAGGVGMTLLCGSIAFAIAYRISVSMRSLSQAALALGEGRPQPPIHSRVSEMHEVIESMKRAAAMLLHHSSERDRAEASLRDATLAAETASQAKSQFLANTSHELRTPLNAVIGYSEMLRNGIAGPMSARQTEFVGDIYQSGVHLLAVINDILDISKAEAGCIELVEEAVDLESLVASCMRLVSAQANAGGLSLSVHVAPGLPPIVADQIRLKQILLNLLSNAVKFTKAGGAVNLTVRCVPDVGIVCTVCDTGVGMDSGDIKLALQPFTQLDAGLARVHQGTGLGLPLAQRLTELHGGLLLVESVKGRGTTVSVTLPTSRIIVPASQQPPNSGAPDLMAPIGAAA